MNRAIAILRPEPGNAITAAAIEALGCRALRLPMFAVRAVAWCPPDARQFDALLVSSANAFRHGGSGLAQLRGLPVHAVGAATAHAARTAGFTVAAVGEGGIESLVPDGRVLRLVGREHRPYAAAASTIVVYASDALTPDLSLLAGGVALVHSARAAARLALLVPHPRDVAVAAISSAAAAALGNGWRAVAVADRPTDASLIAAARSLADRPTRAD